MPNGAATAPLVGALGLLGRAIDYTRASLRLVTSEALTRPTPCRRWDLGALLRHMHDSLGTLHEAGAVGYVALEPAEPGPGEIVSALRSRACDLLGAWSRNDGSELISVAGCPLTAGVLASTGALEVAVHGWDVARACGVRRPLPPELAAELLELVPLLVSDRDRPARFAAPVDVPPLAPAGDRLLAFLGRQP
ncbi:maleylpyruvate isomerase family mycothiol-dependent enzyme [soil metagenome]